MVRFIIPPGVLRLILYKIRRVIGSVKGEMQRIQSEVFGLAASGFQQLMIAGSLFVLLGVLCLIFNKKLGGWIGRSSLTVFGTKESEPPGEIIFRGLACVLGLLYLGFGGMFLASAFK